MRKCLITIGITLLCWMATTHTAVATCASPADVCHHILYCKNNLESKNDVDRRRLEKALNDQNGSGIYTATEACQRNVGDIDQWEKHSAGCNDANYRYIGGLVKERNNCQVFPRERWHCANSGTGEIYGELGHGSCANYPNSKREGALCQCGVFRGQVRRSTLD